MIGFDPAPFVRIEQPAAHEHLVTLPLYTDITDPAVFSRLSRRWKPTGAARGKEEGEEYPVRWRHDNRAGQLYCGRSARATTGARWTAPAIGETIDLAAHARRFPEDGALLTTGAASLQLAGSRALVLGPHDVSPRTLAHEFGHLLGFPDAYLRGYRDLGADGFEVLELVADQDRHHVEYQYRFGPRASFQGLIAAREIQSEMQAGLAALYQRRRRGGRGAVPRGARRATRSISVRRYS